MDWDSHLRWAKRFGISESAARYVNRVIDCSNEDELPAEYRQAVADEAETIAANRGAERGNSALSLVIARDATAHDAGRRKPTRGNIAAECTLRHLDRKGKEFVDAWYLHHYLDYLHERRSSRDTVREVITSYRKEYPEIHSQRIKEFLLEHEEALAAQLDDTDRRSR